MNKITIIHPDGKVDVRTQKEKPNLKQISEAVEGPFQLVPDFRKLNGKSVREIWCNENGKLVGMPINWPMTVAWREYLDSTGRAYNINMAVLNGPIMVVQKV